MREKRPHAAAPPGDYWDHPAVVTAFRHAATPAYLSALVPEAQDSQRLAVDVGCGGGRNTPVLASRGYRTVALDRHTEMLAAAKKEGVPGVTYVQADVARIPLRDAAASVLVCHGVLHNLHRRREIAEALRELRRIAAPGAVLSLNLFSCAYLDAALTEVAPDRYALDNGQVMTLLSPEELTELSGESGWRIVEGPYTYMSEGDPGFRSVWRAVLKPEGMVQ